MSARPIFIFISLLYASAQLCLASGVIYTNVVQPVTVIGTQSQLVSVYMYDRYGLHKIDLSNNTVNPIMMNYLWSVHDISDDQSSIILRRPWAGVNSQTPTPPPALIIKNYFSYDTLSHTGINARFTSNDDIICYVLHTNWNVAINYNPKYDLKIGSISQGSSITLWEEIYTTFYMLSSDKNRIMWFNDVGADSLGIFMHTIDSEQTTVLDARIPSSDISSGGIDDHLYWGNNDILYASLMNSDGFYSLFSLDISQNPDSFTEIVTMDTNLFLLPTQDFGHEKFLFYSNNSELDYQIWVYDIVNETFESLFNLIIDPSPPGFAPGGLDTYTWSSDMTKAYIMNRSICFFGNCYVPSTIYEYDFSSGSLDSLSGSFSSSNRLYYFDNNVNAAPSEIELLHPSNGSSLGLTQSNITDSTTFTWTSSQDVDNDSLSYEFILYNMDVETGVTNIGDYPFPTWIIRESTSDTSITISNNRLYDIFMDSSNSASNISWGVDVTDGFQIVRTDYGHLNSISNNYPLSIKETIIPHEYVLHQNYPNPFNPTTTLRYDLPENSLVTITIYDMMGRIVKTLVNSSQTAGFKSIRWSGNNDRNEPVSAGLYLYTIQAGEFRQTKKMVLLK